MGPDVHKLKQFEHHIHKSASNEVCKIPHYLGDKKDAHETRMSWNLPYLHTKSSWKSKGLLGLEGIQEKASDTAGVFQFVQIIHLPSHSIHHPRLPGRGHMAADSSNQTAAGAI